MEDWLYWNGFGGFSKDGKEYHIRVTPNERTPLPWSHLLVNKRFGTLVTSNGGGFSWYGNSRENKLTTWCNDPVLDTPSERILLEDDVSVWSAFSNQILEKEEFEVVYGFGYAKYLLRSNRYEQEATVFVTENPAQKITLLRLKNLNAKTKKIKIQFLVDAVLGVAKEYTKKHLVKEIESNDLKIFNRYSNDYADYDLHLSLLTFGAEKVKLSSDLNGLMTEIELEPMEERELVFVLDYRLKEEALVLENLGYYKECLEIVKKEWMEKLNKVQVTTPIDSMNIILNGWILYQSLTSRVLGRASFYQSGGAYGFRDQLQDMLAILYVDTKMVRQQIIYHAKHQFPEGDVLHWWHPERSNGIRTRFSDDLLWLAYVTCEYVSFTKDFSILWEDVPFVEGRSLKEGEDEIYIETQPSQETASLLEHCMKAIERSLDFGEHGLPKMGSGDWNDGMNTVGGESVWLGFFLADVLKKFLMMIKEDSFEKSMDYMNKKISEKECEKTSKEASKKIGDRQRKLIEEAKIHYEEKFFELQRNLDKAWDGRWFKRAYFANGEALGSNQNDECKIDNISQSWSVISGVAKKEKQQMAMESVENYLVDHENMLIKLLTPAFCHTKMEPGYIKSYIPGVRENGGQYTQEYCC